jgi:tetratricopeptide (TPR) repeat protein
VFSDFFQPSVLHSSPPLSPPKAAFAFNAVARYSMILGFSFLGSGSVLAQTDTPDPLLPLPGLPSLPAGLDDTPNPLLDFNPSDAARRAQQREKADAQLQPLSPFMPGEAPPAELTPPTASDPSAPLTSAQQALISLAEKVASSVVSIRVWDQYGGLLTSGVGSFVSSDGLILTDASLLHPEIADRIDYITTTAANGTNHRITGFYSADLRTGVALLQGDGPTPQALELQPESDFSKSQPCRVVALSEKRGLLIADAEVAFDDTLAGQGWLTLRGEDSPGGVGSPVLSEQGKIMGVVAMKTPIDTWMNFALPAEWAAFEIEKKRSPLKTLKELPRTPRLAQVSADPDFIIAFQQIQSRSMSAATRTLLRLTKRYPRSSECWALLGLSAGYLGAAPDALTCQRRAVALDPQSGLHWHQMAMAKLRARSAAGESLATPSSEEYQALVNATNENPNDRISWLMLATHHIREGRLNEADEALRRLTFLAPTYAQGFYLMAYVKSRMKDPGAAVQALSRCLSLNDRQPNAWYFLGLLQDKLDEPKQAIEAYRKTVRFRPDHPQAWLNLAHSLKKINRPTEAGQAFREHQKRVLTSTSKAGS